MGCQVGDIIVIKTYVSQGITLGQHSFVVIDAQGGQIQGLDYDVVCNVMSSFHSEEQRQRKLSYPGNLEYSHLDEDVKKGNKKGGYIKADQFYFFDLDKVDYYVIGSITPKLADALRELIKQLPDIELITDNL